MDQDIATIAAAADGPYGWEPGAKVTDGRSVRTLVEPVKVPEPRILGFTA